MALRTDPAITRHVKTVWPDDRLSELIDAREAVERLTVSHGWQCIQSLLSEEIATIDSTLERGAAKDAPEYAKQLGRRSALKAADEAAKAIVEQANVREQNAIRQVAESTERAVA